MYLKFLWVKYKNFLSVGDSFQEIPLDNKEKLVILGKNGSGKSTFIDAICFGLYGKSYRNVTQKQIYNSINKKDCVVEIAFETCGSHYLVRRGLKPNFLEVFKDGEQLQKEAEVKFDQAALDQIIGVPYKTFIQINILGTAGYTPFMQLKPELRRSLVEDLLDSTVYGAMLKLAKEDLKLVKDEVASLDSKIDVVSAKVISHQRLIDRQAEDKSELITSKTTALERHKLNLVSKNEEYAEIGEEYKKLEKKLEDKGFDYDSIVTMQEELSGDIRANDALINSERTKMSRVLNGTVCPSCLQTIDENHKDHIRSSSETEIETKSSENVKLRKRLEKVKAVRAELDDIKEKIADKLSEAKSMRQVIENIKSRIDDIEVEIEDIKNSKKDVEKEDMSELISLNKELESLKFDYDKQNIELEKIKKSITYLGDDGIKAKIIDKYIPTINNQINEYLDHMNLFVQFELDSTFTETIRSRYRDDFKYESFSEGEKLRIDLAILLTWRRMAIKRNTLSSNLLIMDEILDASLDDEGVVDFFNITNNIPDSRNAIVISHKTSLTDEFDNVIIASKVGNFSTYERR